MHLKTTGHYKQLQEYSAGSVKLQVSFISVEQASIMAAGAPCLSLLLVVDGQCEALLGSADNPVELVTGGVLLVPPRASMSVSLEGDARLLILSLPQEHLTYFLSESHLKQSAYFKDLNGQVIYSHPTQNAALRVWHESLSEENHADMMVDGMMLILMAELSRIARSEGNNSVNRLSVDELLHIDQYVGEQLADGSVTVDRLLQQLRLGALDFFKQLEATTGVDPEDYLLNRRLIRARHLLAQGELSEAAISRKSGFHNEAEMVQLFQAHLGFSPQEYRQALLVSSEIVR